MAELTYADELNSLRQENAALKAEVMSLADERDGFKAALVQALAEVERLRAGKSFTFHLITPRELGAGIHGGEEKVTIRFEDGSWVDGDVVECIRVFLGDFADGGCITDEQRQAQLYVEERLFANEPDGAGGA